MSIETAHFAILAGIDGIRTLDEIAELLNLELLDVYEAAVQLQQDGLIKLNPVPSGSVQPSLGRTSVPDSTALKPAKSSVIDRIMSSLHTVGRSPTPKTPPSSYAPPPPSVDDDPIMRLIRS